MNRRRIVFRAPRCLLINGLEVVGSFARRYKRSCVRIARVREKRHFQGTWRRSGIRCRSLLVIRVYLLCPVLCPPWIKDHSNR
jgi:hypothetical protein